MLDRIHDVILKAIGCALFGTDKPEINDCDVKLLLKEAKQHTVFSCIYPVLKNDVKELLLPEEFLMVENSFLVNIAGNMQILSEHCELHSIMTESNIPYVVLKGCASSVYYDEPDFRTMGDVDFLVHECDINRAIKAIEKAGFKRDQYEFTTNQSAYMREPSSVWEIHKSPTGIPKGELGDKIACALSDIIETASICERDGYKFYVPSVVNHGLILLLHKASHLTSSGLGLRHLCDWAVFESSLSNDEFCLIFEEKLKEFGLWKFAQIMTLLCEKYLGVPKRQWAKSCNVSDIELEELMLDILAGGNFGKKDENRYREIKYLTDRNEGKLGNENMVSQALKSLNDKVYNDYSLINKNKFLLPIGWILELSSYVWLLITGKRKSKGTVSMLKEASKRKEIYSKLELFK